MSVNVTYINRLKDINHMITSINTEIVLDKFLMTFLIKKKPQESRNKRNVSQPTVAIYDKFLINTILNRENSRGLPLSLG